MKDWLGCVEHEEYLTAPAEDENQVAVWLAEDAVLWDAEEAEEAAIAAEISRNTTPAELAEIQAECVAQGERYLGMRRSDRPWLW